MAGTTVAYWNTLAPDSKAGSSPLPALESLAVEFTLSFDENTGQYSPLTRFLPGANTPPFGGKSHQHPEGVFLLSGRRYGRAYGLSLETGACYLRCPCGVPRAAD